MATLYSENSSFSWRGKFLSPDKANRIKTLFFFSLLVAAHQKLALCSAGNSRQGCKNQQNWINILGAGVCCFNKEQKVIYLHRLKDAIKRGGPSVIRIDAGFGSLHSVKSFADATACSSSSRATNHLGIIILRQVFGSTYTTAASNLAYFLPYSAVFMQLLVHPRLDK